MERTKNNSTYLLLLLKGNTFRQVKNITVLGKLQLYNSLNLSVQLTI